MDQPISFTPTATLYFVHGHRRIQSTTSKIEAPGLWMLSRSCNVTDPNSDKQAGVLIESVAQDIILIASVPLTDESWQPIDEGELVIVRSGQRLNH